MKQIFILILSLMTFALQAKADESDPDNSSQEIEFEYSKSQQSTARHRVPTRINLVAWYNAESGSIEIVYDGEAEGEVFLYLNGNIIGYDSNINTSFQISVPGLYKIEIVSESWTAIGFLQL